MENDNLTIGDVSFKNPIHIHNVEWVDSMENWPKITKENISHYVIDSQAFDNKPADARKSLQASNYLESGWVGKLKLAKVGDTVVALKGDVTPSQKLTKKDHHAWFVSKLDGTILTASCTCMAGKARVCSHVTALMFKVEFWNSELARGPSCTDGQNQWNSGTKRKIEPVAFIDIEFSKHQNYIVKEQKMPPQFYSQESLRKHFLISDLAELVSMPGSVINDVLNTKIIDKPIVRNILSPSKKPNCSSVGNIVHGCHEINADETLTSEALKCNVCRSFFKKFVDIGQTNIDKLKEETVMQGESPLWAETRRIHITGSTAKGLPKKTTTSPINFIKNHIFPKFRGNSATALGNIMEPVAKYIFSDENLLHVDQVGIIISEKEPWLSASPDGLIGCDKMLEVKCPVTQDLEALVRSNKYDVKLDKAGKYYLNENGKNGYYLQIQIQLFCASRSLYYFYVFSSQMKIQLEVPYNEKYMEQILKKIRNVYGSLMLPFIVNAYHEKKLKLSYLSSILQKQLLSK